MTETQAEWVTELNFKDSRKCRAPRNLSALLCPKEQQKSHKNRKLKAVATKVPPRKASLPVPSPSAHPHPHPHPVPHPSASPLPSAVASSQIHCQYAMARVSVRRWQTDGQTFAELDSWPSCWRWSFRWVDTTLISLRSRWHWKCRPEHWDG